MDYKQTELPDSNPAKIVDEQTDKRVYEHLTDKTDVISEEDIKNIITDIGTGVENENKVDSDEQQPGDETAIENEENIKVAEERHRIKEDNDPGIDTAWNILDS